MNPILNQFFTDADWKKQAASDSAAVDKDAVEAMFMNQAYGIVANRGKALFAAPFLIGFEVVHRNEKATKMVGIFAFRCNKSLLYVPVFFVNGAVKGADMIYRADVKRFVGFFPEMCEFLIRGTGASTGQSQSRNVPQQADSYMDRLAYPQRIKYAARQLKEAGIDGGAVWREMYEHASQEDTLTGDRLLPEYLRHAGPQGLEKLSAWIANDEISQRFLAEHYTAGELADASAWPIEKAAAKAQYRLQLVTDISQARDEDSRQAIIKQGYSLEDFRYDDDPTAKVIEIEDPSIYQVSSPGSYRFMMVDGKTEDGVVLEYCYSGGKKLFGSGFSGAPGVPRHSSNDSMKLLRLNDGRCQQLDEGDEVSAEQSLIDHMEPQGKPVSSVEVGKAYLMVHIHRRISSEPFYVLDKTKDGKATRVSYATGRWVSGPDADFLWMDEDKVAEAEQNLFDNDYRVVEVECTKEEKKNGEIYVEYWSTLPLMTGAQIDQWIRTSGGVTHSSDITIKGEPSGLFGINTDGFVGNKVASCGRLNAHIFLCELGMSVKEAEQQLVLAEAANEEPVTFRLYEPIITAEKLAFATMMREQPHWIHGYDSDLGVRVDTPQTAQLQTYTPQARTPIPRYGDHYAREMTQENDGSNIGPLDQSVPMDTLMNSSPSQLANLAQRYNLPHVFDHGIVGTLSCSELNTKEQVRSYVPDIETGLDRIYRILFLLRYRPADFEEAYGKDEQMEMEDEISSVADSMSKMVLKLMKRFDADRIAAQVDN